MAQVTHRYRATVHVAGCTVALRPTALRPAAPRPAPPGPRPAAPETTAPPAAPPQHRRPPRPPRPRRPPVRHPLPPPPSATMVAGLRAVAPAPPGPGPPPGPRGGADSRRFQPRARAERGASSPLLARRWGIRPVVESDCKLACVWSRRIRGGRSAGHCMRASSDGIIVEMTSA